MKQKQSIKILGIPLRPQKTDSILEYILKDSFLSPQFLHIVSVNPEILVQSQDDEEYKKIVSTAQIQLIDGIGVVGAGYLLHGVRLPRLAGAQLLELVLKVGGERGLSIGLIGGKADIAETIADCYGKIYPRSTFFGTQGFVDIKNPQKNETKAVNTIVKARRPHIVFVSFGSPAQEKWIEDNRALFEGVICVGVGGAFDFVAGKTKRAPTFVQDLGAEWLWRLLHEPWRWRRQLRLVRFVYLVCKQKIFKQ